MKTIPDPLASRLLPKPQQIKQQGKPFSPRKGHPLIACISEKLRADLTEGLTGLRQALAAWSPGSTLHLIPTLAPVTDLALSLDVKSLNKAQAGWLLKAGPEAYVLRMDGGIHLTALTAKGLFYGLQTLIQILRAITPGSPLPGLLIQDKPALAWRGMMYDIARDQVIHLPYLKSLIAELAHYKMNYFGLYLEHRIATPSTRETAPPGSLTLDEIHELEDWCRRHFVELIPFTNSLGHVEGFLYHERYQELAEDPHHPFQACPSNPKAVRFLEQFLGEMAGMFKSRYFHLGGDESWHLGRCPKCKERADKEGRGVLYAEHFVKMIRAVKRAGKIPMIWADMLYRQLSPPEYKAVLDAIPKDTVLFVWEYAGSAEAPARKLKQIGFNNLVLSPSTNSFWSVFYPEDRVWGNTPILSQEALKLGAWGLFNTSWEMHKGSFFDYNWLPAVLSADTAWNPEIPSQEVFNRAFQEQFFGFSGNEAAEFTRLVNYACLPAPLRDNARLRHALLRPRLLTVNDVQRFRPEPNPFGPGLNLNNISPQEFRDARRAQAQARKLLAGIIRRATRHAEVLTAWEFALDLAALGLDRVESVQRIHERYHQASEIQFRNPRRFAQLFKQILAEFPAWKAQYRDLAEKIRRTGAPRGLGSSDRIIAEAGVREVDRLADIFKQLSKARDPLPRFDLVAHHY